MNSDCSGGDLPLHDGGVVATQREQVVIPRGEANLRNVATVTQEWLKACASVNHLRVSVQLDLAIVVCCGDDFLPAGQWTISPVRMIDVGAVLAWLPAALHGPPKNGALGVPGLILEVGSSARILRTIRNGVVQDLIGAIVGADGCRVLAPVDMRDERGALPELLRKPERWDLVEINLVVVRPYGQVIAIGREFEVLYPLLRDFLAVLDAPVLSVVDAE